MCLVFAFDHISGAHFNPAVSFSFWVAGRKSFFKLVGYVIVQVGGGMTGALLAYCIAGAKDVEPFKPDNNMAHPLLSAFLVELMFSFILAFTVQMVSLKNAEEPNSYFGLAIGFVVLAGASGAGGISGGVFNPAIGTAVDFASLLSGGSLSRLWIYWTAPPLGGLLAGLLTRYFRRAVEREDEEREKLLQRQAEARQQGRAEPEDDAIWRLPPRVLIMELLGALLFSVSLLSIVLC